MLGVVIVTFHSERTIERCLNAVFAESLPTDSVTIVDNSENHLTVQTISRFKGRISIIRNESNLGYSIAANKGMAAQQCDAYLLLNPDTQLFQGGEDVYSSISRMIAWELSGRSPTMYAEGSSSHFTFRPSNTNTLTPRFSKSLIRLIETLGR